MQVVLEFLYDNAEMVVQTLFSFLAVIAFFVNYVRTGKIDKELKNLIFKENNDMIYKTPNSAAKVSTQEFSETVPDYVLNERTNVLERSPIDKDIQAYIQSYCDCALDKLLEKFLPQDVVLNEKQDTLHQMQIDIGAAADVFDLAEDYREKYNLDDSWNISQIFEYVQQQADKLNADISAVLEKKEPNKDVE